ncbi:acireductone synthase [Cryptosporangium phraense]|uniref:Enolase-phosphatase E1 n=1 Tax=Cryptosporangium phraense TaxID=2593070 RepID=A0A545AWD9_9ACTN|nr:acireductone synthase [Cryptosporangium phraense]TQS45646.1 acireductone synthase [Cryptosporangium phraense]
MTHTARVVVLDIEGTTSAAGFVQGDLYDYARPRLRPWIEAHADDPAIAAAVSQTRADGGLSPDADVDAVVAVLHGWMDADVKATPLKTIQGQLWAAGFAAGELQSHFFADVVPQLRAWHERGVRLAVFSSGSVASQVPWFRHADAGDLTPMIEDYFDTVSAGSKREASSYEKIASALGVAGNEALFLTDLPAELDAATAAGWQVVGVRREGEPNYGGDFGRHPVVATFDEVDVVAPGGFAAGAGRAAGGFAAGAGPAADGGAGGFAAGAAGEADGEQS